MYGKYIEYILLKQDSSFDHEDRVNHVPNVMHLCVFFHSVDRLAVSN